MISDAPLKDDAVVQQLSQDVGEDVFPVLKQAFKEEVEGCTTTLRKTLAEVDLALFETTAHALKSAAASVGAMRLSDICRELEAASRDNASQDTLKNLLDDYLRVVEQTNQAFGF